MAFNLTVKLPETRASKSFRSLVYLPRLTEVMNTTTTGVNQQEVKKT
jgi:hypothetical protein